MQELFRTIYKKSGSFLILLFLICFPVGFAEAGNLSKEAILEKENEALRLSREWSAESIRRSINLYSESAEDWLKTGESGKASRCLRETALLLMISSEYEPAIANLKKALLLARKANDPDGKIIILSILSRVAYQAGNTPESEKYYKEAILLSESTASPLARANAFFSAAEYNLFFGDIKQTINFYEKALGFAEKAGDKKLMSQILVNLGFSHLREGNNFVGLQKEKEALEKAEEIGDKRAQAVALNGLGSLYVFFNEKRTALEIFQRAEAMYPEDFDLLEKGKLFNGIATIYEDYGEFGLAENYRKRAFELFGRAKYPYGQLATLPSLARLSYLKGDKDSGKKLYDETLILAERLKSDFHLAIVKEDLGELNFKDGLYDGAIKNYQEALEVYGKLKIKLPRIENKLGEVYAAKKDFSKAREYFISALKTNRQTKDMLPAAESLYHLAKLEYSEGRLQASLEQIKESLSITESLYLNVANNKLGSSFISNIYDRYELYVNLLMKMHKNSPSENYALQALQAAEKSRARVMLENLSLSEANFTMDADAETVRREKEIRVLLNAKADKLTGLLSQNAERSETDKLSGEINELENELENIKARLRQQSPVYSSIKNPAPFDAADFQQNVLDADSLLLEFSFGAEESYLWTVGKSEVGVYVLPPREEIESSIETLRRLLKERELKPGEPVGEYQKRISEAETEYQSEAAELSRKLFGQIAGKLEKKRLIIVPDGELRYFPVSALPLPGSEDGEPILLTNETVYEPSAQTLAVLTRRPRQSVPAKNLLVFSDPVFTSDDARFSPEDHPGDKETTRTEKFRFVESLNNLARLAASKDESETIIETVGASLSENYSGFRATRENLLDLKTEDYKILHFATHSFVSEQRPELSGIVLSRFDQNGQKLDEFFRIHDIYGLNLNADLVVLSACETGVGKEIKGEGLMSLNNAFLQTGARSVMASLWKVEDGATLELMKNFYGGLADERLTPSEALRRAQIKLRENPQYKSPFFWAAFTVQGDFRSVPKISTGGFGFWVYLLPVAPLALIGFYLFRRKNRKNLQP